MVPATSRSTLGAWGEVKQCAAASGRKRNATEAELIQQDRAAQAAPVPERNAGEHTVAAVISKRKQGNSKCILWESTAGELLNNECTWEQAAFDIVASALLGKSISLKLGQAEHKGSITKQHEGKGTSHWIEFDSRRHTHKWVDLELPRLVKDGEYSYWKLDGFKTWEGPINDDSEAESSDDDEMPNGSDSD